MSVLFLTSMLPGCRRNIGQLFFGLRFKHNINDPDRYMDTGRLLRDESRTSKAADAARRYQERKAGVSQAPSLDDDPNQVSLAMMGTTAMEHLIDRQITASMDRGEFSNLAGKGKPLAHSHDAQFASTDPLVSALTRSMGAQNVKPPSIELRDELRRVKSGFNEACQAAFRKGPAQRQAVLQGLDAGVQHHWTRLQEVHKQYNTACLVDKECFGFAWPLNPLPKLVFAVAVAEAEQDA